MTEKLIETEKWIRIKLIQISLLLEKMNDLLNSDIKNQKEKVDNLKIKNNPKFMDSVYKRGYKTINDIKKLEKLEPLTAMKYQKQIWISLKLDWEETKLNLAKDNFHQLTLKSIFLLIMAHIENSLRTVCEQLKEEKKLLLGWNDLKGSTLDVYKNYITKVAKFSYDFGSSKNWNSIKDNYILRNYLIHNEGGFDNSEKFKRLKKIVDDSDELKFNNKMEFELSLKYLHSLIDQADNFIDELFRHLS
ncbi:MAG: hypothetical protein WAU11_14970 [Ignavibacteriaceae bacterium]